MSLLFGKEFNHGYSWAKVLGSLLVCFGFLSSGYHMFNSKNQENKNICTVFISTMFLQIIFLCFLQWESLNFKQNIPLSLLLPLQGNFNAYIWFTPLMFGISGVFQLCTCKDYKGKIPSKREWITYGGYGGIATGLSGILIIKAIEISRTSIENVLIYPLFSISTLLVCQFWANFFYQEKIQWKTHVLCVFGVILSYF